MGKRTSYTTYTFALNKLVYNTNYVLSMSLDIFGKGDSKRERERVGVKQQYLK